MRLPKRLAILRHAKSDWNLPGLADFDRPLNARGRAAADLIRRAIAARGLAFDFVLSSPSKRTCETLDRLGLAESAKWDDRLYLASCERLLGNIRALPDAVHSALIVGHNPGLHDLVLELSALDSEGFRTRVAGKYPTAALALIDLDIESWSQAEAGCGRIAELLLPRDLG